MSRPVRPWHLLLLPLVLAANYAVAVARHEWSHTLVARAFGADVPEIHLWPPRGVNLSWITLGFRRPPHPWAVPAQAAAPYVVALALITASLWGLGRLPAGIVRANLVVTGVIFPGAELVTNVLAYWRAPNDLYWMLGTHAVAARVGVTLAVVLVLAAAGRRTARALR